MAAYPGYPLQYIQMSDYMTAYEAPPQIAVVPVHNYASLPRAHNIDRRVVAANRQGNSSNNVFTLDDSITREVIYDISAIITANAMNADMQSMISQSLANANQSGQPYVGTTVPTPPIYGTAKDIDPRYPGKHVDTRRAIGFALVATCLCPPLGLASLGTALSARKSAHEGNYGRAKGYRRVSYGFTILAAIMIVMGIIIIVLLSQKYNRF